jgi:hypothetical protein
MQQQTPNIPLSMAMGAGAVLMTLLDAMVAKGLLSKEDVRSLLGEARRVLMSSADPNATEATRIVDKVVGRYSDR